MFEYKARAELFDDVIQVINALNNNEIRFRNKNIKSDDNIFDATEWHFTCELPLNKLIKFIKVNTQDCHIIYGTINYPNLYNGVRDYERC
jgi:hypothetical protein